MSQREQGAVSACRAVARGGYNRGLGFPPDWPNLLERLMRRLLPALAGAALALVYTPAYAAGNPENGRQLAFTCSGCHGIEEYRNAYPSYRVPKIAGQNEAYLANSLKAYRDGSRQHPTMVAQASSFSDQDIADLAAYFSTQGRQ